MTLRTCPGSSRSTARPAIGACDRRTVAAGRGCRAVPAPDNRRGDDNPPRVAVLPFKNVGGTDEGLVAGMWEDAPRTIAQPATHRARPQHVRAEMGSGAAREAADYLVEASVRTATDRVRINSSLIRSTSRRPDLEPNFRSQA